MGSHYLPELISVTWLLCLILLPILDELEQYTQRNLQLREISGAARSVEGDEWSVQNSSTLNVTLKMVHVFPAKHLQKPLATQKQDAGNII